MAKTGTASLTIAELREFASFSPCEQRYIKRSLDVGLGGRTRSNCGRAMRRKWPRFAAST